MLKIKCIKDGKKKNCEYKVAFASHVLVHFKLCLLLKQKKLSSCHQHIPIYLIILFAWLTWGKVVLVVFFCQTPTELTLFFTFLKNKKTKLGRSSIKKTRKYVQYKKSKELPKCTGLFLLDKPIEYLSDYPNVTSIGYWSVCGQFIISWW